MDFQRTPRRSFLASGLTGLVLAGSSSLPNLSNAYAGEAPAPPPVQGNPFLLKERPFLFEVRPASKQYTAGVIGSKEQDYGRKKQIPPISDLKFLNTENPLPKADLDIILSEDTKPIPLIDPRKETQRDIEKQVNQAFDDHISNLTAVVCIKDKTQYIAASGIFINPEFIIAPYYVLEDAIKGNRTSHCSSFSEDSQNLNNEIKVVAYSQSRNIALCHAKKPNPYARTIKIASAVPYQGERAIGLYRVFLTDSSKLKENRNIKQNENIPLSPFSGMSFRWNNQENIDLILTSGFNHILSIGYITDALQKDELKVSPSSDPMFSSFNVPGLLNVEEGNIGSPILTNNKFIGIITTITGKTNLCNITPPQILRLLVRQYQAEALKRAAPAKK